MSTTAPSADELKVALGRAVAALEAGDLDTASGDMEAAAELCGRLQTAGVRIPGPELAQLRELYERCGVFLVQTGEKLNADSFREEQHRRGVEAYRARTSGAR